MFRNKIMVTTRLASPTPSSFFLLHLSLSDSSPPIEIETLCWKLSRRFRLACFHPSPSSIFVIYQKNQTESAAQVVEEIGKALVIINVEDEEEVSSATLLATAIECWFRSLMLEKSWRCVGDCTFVESTFACDEEKTHVQALNVRVRSENDVTLVFLVSPDVIWFTRDKIIDLVASRTLQNFNDGNIAVVEKDMLFTACTVLPTLYNGHIIGLSKLPPVAEKFDLLEELWLMKHGLTLPSDYYINVHFSYGDQASNQWFPSAFILRGSGLSPAPQTVRSSMAVNALNSFIKTIGCSDFFNQGLLKVKEVSSIETLMMQPAWKVARTAGVDNKSITSTQESVKDQCIISQNSHLTLDFRTPKPALHCISANRMLDHDKSNATAVLKREEMAVITTSCSIKPPIPKTLNEVVQAPVKAPPLGQSEDYQRGSDFFNQGLLKVKEVSSIETLMMQPAWKVARTAGVDNRSITSTQESVKDQCIISQNSHLTLDFRTPKPALHYISANRMLDHDKSNATAVLKREEMAVLTTTCSIKPPIPKTLNEVVQAPVKAPPLGQSQAYQRGSDLFNQGLLKVKEVSSIETLMMQPAWKVARTAGVDDKSITSTQESVKDQCIISQNSHLTLDFRTPKPALHYISANRMLDHDKSNATAVLKREEMAVITTTCSIKPPIPKTLNEVVQAPVKASTLGQSQTYQRVDSKEVNSESRQKKKKAKQHTDSSDVNSKVSDFHARGKLQSLTVPDLKHFLASRKVKVGGKKDELIQRVLEILG